MGRALLTFSSRFVLIRFVTLTLTIITHVVEKHESLPCHVHEVSAMNCMLVPAAIVYETADSHISRYRTVARMIPWLRPRMLVTAPL